MKETMFIIQFVNGKMKKFDHARFSLEVDRNAGVAYVFSNISKDLILEANLDHVMYIHRNIVKRSYNKPTESNEVDDIPVEEFDSEVEE